MKHDPMCPMTTPDGYLCCCNLIARVREDERKQYAAKWYSQAELDAAVSDALDKAREAVRNECFHDEGEWCIFVAAIDGVTDKTPSDEGRNTG